MRQADLWEYEPPGRWETPPEARHRNTQSIRLRRALADQEWHLGNELDVSVGWRFGGALERIRKGLDRLPIWEVLSERLEEDGSRWRYRWTGHVLKQPQLIKRQRTVADFLSALERLVLAVSS